MFSVPQPLPGTGQVLAHHFCLVYTVALAAYYPSIRFVADRVQSGKWIVAPQKLKFATFLYNLSAGILSMLGFYLIIQDPVVSAPSGWYPETDQLPTTRFVIIVFCLTKPFEFLDTFLHSALKGKDPSFLHTFHHIATSIASWFALHTNCHYQHNPVMMNLFVHAWMFNYFALQEYLPPGPKKIVRLLRMPITFIQVAQMFLGAYGQAYVVFTDKYKHDWPQWELAIAGIGMYMFYICIFGDFFMKEYVCRNKSESKSQVAGTLDTCTQKAGLENQASIDKKAA